MDSLICCYVIPDPMLVDHTLVLWIVILTEALQAEKANLSPEYELIPVKWIIPISGWKGTKVVKLPKCDWFVSSRDSAILGTQVWSLFWTDWKFSGSSRQSSLDEWNPVLLGPSIVSILVTMAIPLIHPLCRLWGDQWWDGWYPLPSTSFEITCNAHFGPKGSYLSSAE